jgi:VCBS repeat protein
MGNALEIAKHLSKLKKYSVDLNSMIEDGSFYRLSFIERFKLVRRVKKLYNRLLGPVSAIKLRHIVAAAGVLALNTACFVPVGTSPDLRTGGTDDPGSTTTGSGAFSLLPYFAARGPNPYGIQPIGGEAVTFNVPGSPDALAAIVYGEGSGSAFVDLDGDGDFDLVHSGFEVGGTLAYEGDPDAYGGLFIAYDTFSAARLRYQENIGTPTEPEFGPTMDLPVDFVPYVGGITFADMDDDGDQDLWLASAFAYLEWSGPPGAYIWGYVESAGLAFFENTGTAMSPAFEFQGAQDVDVYTYWRSRPDVALGDLDADGDFDLLFGSTYGISHFENTGTPEAPQFDFDAPNESPFGLAGLASYSEYGFGLALVDVDRDGDLDIVSVGNWYVEGYGSAYQGVVVLNEGGGDFPAFSTVMGEGQIELYIESPWNTGYPRVVDIDADGDLDVFVAEPGYYIEGSYIESPDGFEEPMGALHFFENLVIGGDE